LHVQWKRRGETVQIILLCGFALRFQEELMSFFFCECYDFSLNTWTISRAYTVDLSVVEW
jgi:hypothetical protein